ncbi:hypothetical protein KP509_14G049700 [Ceratopteris richardii]|uniref:Hypoxanthine phosphoribosyltransferase n=1 Tax=Ceratopteris richardii TaxID=49495 RepID=A0A8T2TCI4_CERRI|nr:hypothetical protein KP509_14G049700 [Ceratopteris richardii]KAH7415524.1 hypothetical protein KP509_14G049700 [Ceratopteris richardii]
MSSLSNDGRMQAEEDMERVLWSPTDIEKRVVELGASISHDFSHSLPLIVIAVATGAFMFAADLVRKISLPISIEFIRVQSYGNRTESSGVAVISTELQIDIIDKHVLVIEDIIDTGTTLSRLVSYLKEKGAASVSVCALLDKVLRRKIPLQLPPGSRFYRGFECPDDFVVGYGMDFAEEYRNLPYIGLLKPAKYSF